MKPLTDTQLLVIQAEIMTNTGKDALAFLEKHKHKMSRMTYWRHQNELRKSATARLYEEAKGAVDSQMKIIDELVTVKKQLWILFDDADQPIEIIEKIRILHEIREVIPHITAAKAAIPHVIAEVIKNFGQEEEDNSTKSGSSKKAPITAKN